MVSFFYLSRSSQITTLSARASSPSTTFLLPVTCLLVCLAMTEMEQVWWPLDIQPLRQKAVLQRTCPTQQVCYLPSDFSHRQLASQVKACGCIFGDYGCQHSSIGVVYTVAFSFRWVPRCDSANRCGSTHRDGSSHRRTGSGRAQSQKPCRES